ncbi:MAG: HPr family phosphocarrier protein [Ruminococcus flavefaciens]|nr:HPr family phosphocarrier protein [Ruminococcus flavefaciens]
MKEFTYTVQNRLGIHARPASEINRLASKYESVIRVQKGEKEADAKRILQLMGLNVQYGNHIKITFLGIDEEYAYETIKNYFQSNM